MKILGVNIGHDSNACFLEDGEIIRYAAEERFNRIKTGVNGPLKSVQYCVGEHGLDGMDSIAISSGITGIVKANYQVLFKNKTTPGIPLELRKYGTQVDVKEVSHHDCHAASAYYTSGLNDSLIVTVDGIGDTTTQYVGMGDGASIKPLSYIRKDGVYTRGKDGVFKGRLFKSPKVYSWGWFYGNVTSGLGFRMCTDEGKTMGLAPYGDPHIIPEKEMKQYMYKTQPEGFIHTDGRVYYHFGGAEDYEKMAKRYGPANLAASAQKILEDKVVTYIKKWLKRTGQKRLCTAGGVFLNVKLNQRIIEECDLETYWPFPLSSDVGISIGAAYVEHYKLGGIFNPKRITNLYWGPEYSNDSIVTLLRRNKLVYRDYDVDYIADALAANKIVAWFQGRMEGGPRALGGRSILMSPLKAQNKDIINAQVKFRESFRPFCPSVTAEAADRYFDGGNEFMIIACNVKSPHIPAVTHVDNTARPQIVRYEDNPKFHELLNAFAARTGHPVLLNTSLNIMGEPIVNKPEEAIRCFYGVGLDMLVMGDYVLEKDGGTK